MEAPSDILFLVYVHILIHILVYGHILVPILARGYCLLQYDLPSPLSLCRLIAKAVYRQHNLPTESIWI